MFACFNYTLLLASKDMHRGFIDIRSYISAHVLLNLLNELGKEIKCETCRGFHLFLQRVL